MLIERGLVKRLFHYQCDPVSSKSSRRFSSINCHRPDNRRAFFEHFASVPFQAGTVLVCQANRGLPSQFCSGCFTQLGRILWAAAVIEGNEAAVERGIPERRQKQAVVHVQSILVALAILPRLDVGGPKQRVVGDARQRATALPVGDQTVSEYPLSNTLHHQTLCFGRLRHPLRSVQELLQGGVGETDREFV